MRSVDETGRQRRDDPFARPQACDHFQPIAIGAGHADGAPLHAFSDHDEDDWLRPFAAQRRLRHQDDRRPAIGGVIGGLLAFVLAQGLSYALAMGLVGGLMPAIKAARLPIASALCEL